jgi:TPP-dependent indolepyruvate ferredoxin oxidoreductase alpha subunit
VLTTQEQLKREELVMNNQPKKETNTEAVKFERLDAKQLGLAVSGLMYNKV